MKQKCFFLLFPLSSRLCEAMSKSHIDMTALQCSTILNSSLLNCSAPLLASVHIIGGPPAVCTTGQLQESKHSVAILCSIIFLPMANRNMIHGQGIRALIEHKGTEQVASILKCCWKQITQMERIRKIIQMERALYFNSAWGTPKLNALKIYTLMHYSHTCLSIQQSLMSPWTYLVFSWCYYLILFLIYISKSPWAWVYSPSK